MRCASARENARLNGLDDRVDALEADGLEALKQLDTQGRTFQVIVLDPPAFAKNKTHYSHAMRAYKRLERPRLEDAARRRLSAHVLLLVPRQPGRLSRSPDASRRRSPAGRADRPRRGRGGDHPVLANVPETEYLKALLLEVVERF